MKLTSLRATTNKYDTTFQKKVGFDRENDLPNRSPKAVLQCIGCGAFYHHRHWSLTAPGGLKSPHLYPVLSGVRQDRKYAPRWQSFI